MVRAGHENRDLESCPKDQIRSIDPIEPDPVGRSLNSSGNLAAWSLILLGDSLSLSHSLSHQCSRAALVQADWRVQRAHVYNRTVLAVVLIDNPLRAVSLRNDSVKVVRPALA